MLLFVLIFASAAASPGVVKVWPEHFWSNPAVSNRDVRIDSGIVRGYVKSDHDGDYVAYIGIPYADPPTGSKRFLAPVAPKPWLNVFHANRTVHCPQQGVGDEDCLVMNVFTPTSVNHQMPVLVYIHGGSFIMGSGPTQGLGHLLNQKLIVVTFNYRLGVLGFLCLGTDDAPGNAGLKDQNAALQWIKRNIHQFGGDPNKVTLYGMSAGAASVHYHVLSKKSAGLFHNAIIESGSATSVWAIDTDPINTAKHFTTILNPSNPIRNLEELVHYLRGVPAHELSDANFRLYQYLIDGRFGFVPCLENQYNSGEAFLLDPPVILLENKSYTGVPIMFSYASLEGLCLRSQEYYDLDYKNRMNENFASFIPADLDISKDPVTDLIVHKLKKEYFGDKGIVDDEHLIGYLNYFGDYLIMNGLLYSVEKHAESVKPVYLMEFAYKSDRGCFEKFYEYINKPGHGDIARNIISTKPAVSRSDRLTTNRLTQLLANFVKFSIPTPYITPRVPAIWPRVVPGNLTYLLLDQDVSIHYEHDSSRKRLWSQLYNKYRSPIKPVNPFIYL